MDQWSPAYHDPAGASRRYNGNSQMTPRDYAGQQGPGQAPGQPPSGFKYEQYSGGLASHASPNPATSPAATPQLRDNNGDVAMADANDPYASMKYPMRPHHSQHPSSSSRSSTLHSPPEPSAAAQRYSPMEVLSPTSPYAKAGGGQFSAPPTSRQSPTRQGDYSTPQSPYYQSSRQSSAQLPPMAPFPSALDHYAQTAGLASPGRNDSWANDPTSPRRLVSMPPAPLLNKGPVPEFRKLRTAQDLRPKVNTQPAFRRANPEGGFISVCLLLTPPSPPLSYTDVLTIAPPSPDGSPAGDVPHLQPELQIRVVAEPTSGPHEAQQGLQE